MTDFLSSLKIAATGLHAQNARMRIIAENLANADSTAPRPGGACVVGSDDRRQAQPGGRADQRRVKDRAGEPEADQGRTQVHRSVL